MSDYMFMLESHLNPKQNQVVAEVRSAAAAVGAVLYLTGGAMRDMLGGFPIRDLDFAVEGDATRVVKELTRKAGAELVSRDPHLHTAELLFQGEITVEVGMARKEKYGRPGTRPQVSPATIHEDLLNRDFSVNAIALSLNTPSLGLLIDPSNGLSDLERKELRAISTYGLYDDPIRIFRLHRLRIRLGYAVEQRTAQQFENSHAAEAEKQIGPRKFLEELQKIAAEPNPGAVVQALEEVGLLQFFSPALAGPKTNQAGLAKYHKALQMIPFGADLPFERTGLFLFLLTEKLNAKEKADLVKRMGMEKGEVSRWQRLELRAKKLEKSLQSSSLQKPSSIYALLSKVPLEEVLFLLVHSPVRLVHDRIKNYLQKYLPAALEITEREVIAEGFQPGTPKFDKAKAALILAHLDERKKKAPEPPPEVAAVPVPPPQRGRMRGRPAAAV